MTLGFAFFCHIMRSMDLIDRIVFLLVLTYCSSMNFFFSVFCEARMFSGFLLLGFDVVFSGGWKWSLGWCFFFFFLSIERGIKNPCCLLHMIVFASS
jgi:hypothetical protein